MNENPLPLSLRFTRLPHENRKYGTNIFPSGFIAKNLKNPINIISHNYLMENGSNPNNLLYLK
jgi:hypothetical protein